MERTIHNTSWGYIIWNLLLKGLKWALKNLATIIWAVIYKIGSLTIGYIWIGIRYLMYYLNKAIFKAFNLAEIDYLKVHDELQGDYVALNRHEVKFKKTQEFTKTWSDFTSFVIALRLEKEHSLELMEYVKILLTEAERGAFKISYDYLKTKKSFEPSFDNMILEKVIEEKKLEDRQMWEPYSTTLVEKLRHQRKKKEDDERVERLRKNGTLYR